MGTTEMATLKDFQDYINNFVVLEEYNTDSYYQANEDLLDVVIQEEYVDQIPKTQIPEIVKGLALDYNYLIYNSKAEAIEDFYEIIKENVYDAVERIAQGYYLLTSFAETHFYDSKYYDNFVEDATKFFMNNIGTDKMYNILISNNMLDEITKEYEEILGEMFTNNGYYDNFYDEMVEENLDFIVNEDIEFLKDAARLGNLYYIPNNEKVTDDFDFYQGDLLNFYKNFAYENVVGSEDLIEGVNGLESLFSYK